MQDGKVVGLITYRMDEHGCMIGSLDSLQQSKGIGSALIEAVEDVARQAGCKRIWLITTNDNLNALRFYQKRGFVLAEVRLNVMQKLRQVKPEIPLTGFDGIPIRDEIELERILG
jgi:ribosomal protein S18 acetylase RimI-like enzyme